MQVKTNHSLWCVTTGIFQDNTIACAVMQGKYMYNVGGYIFAEDPIPL